MDMDAIGVTGKQWIIGLIALLPWAAQGGAYQGLDEIRAAARDFVLSQAQTAEGRLEVEIGALDRRLHLPRCDQALEAFMPPGGRLRGNTTIGVRCAAGKPWKLYVPAKIRLLGRVLVARNHLPRGSRIQADDLRYAEFDLARLNGAYYTDSGKLTGKVLKQSITAGRIIQPRMIDEPKLVQRGEGVTILAVSGGFEIRMKGKALMDGSAGQLIKVKNVKSRRIVEGEVVAPGLVRVRL